ncbi:hypothetical protein ACG83_34855 [Frankia sp. R43]|nr:hypothetical protein ACG83_34855 [Frankia sp. R43]
MVQVVAMPFVEDPHAAGDGEGDQQRERAEREPYGARPTTGTAPAGLGPGPHPDHDGRDAYHAADDREAGHQGQRAEGNGHLPGAAAGWRRLAGGLAAADEAGGEPAGVRGLCLVVARPPRAGARRGGRVVIRPLGHRLSVSPSRRVWRRCARPVARSPDSSAVVCSRWFPSRAWTTS